jgi:hypothetical protein
MDEFRPDDPEPKKPKATPRPGDERAYEDTWYRQLREVDPFGDKDEDDEK